MKRICGLVLLWAAASIGSAMPSWAWAQTSTEDDRLVAGDVISQHGESLYYLYGRVVLRVPPGWKKVSQEGSKLAFEKMVSGITADHCSVSAGLNDAGAGSSRTPAEFADWLILDYIESFEATNKKHRLTRDTRRQWRTIHHGMAATRFVGSAYMANLYQSGDGKLVGGYATQSTLVAVGAHVSATVRCNAFNTQIREEVGDDMFAAVRIDASRPRVSDGLKPRPAPVAASKPVAAPQQRWATVDMGHRLLLRLAHGCKVSGGMDDGRDVAQVRVARGAKGFSCSNYVDPEDDDLPNEYVTIEASNLPEEPITQDMMRTLDRNMKSKTGADLTQARQTLARPAASIAARIFKAFGIKDYTVPEASISDLSGTLALVAQSEVKDAGQFNGAKLTIVYLYLEDTFRLIQFLTLKRGGSFEPDPTRHIMAAGAWPKQ